MKLKSSLSLLDISPDFPQIVKNSTSFKMLLNEVTKLLDLPDYPEYFFWLSTSCIRYQKFRMLLKEVTKLEEVTKSVLNIFLTSYKL